MPVMQRVQSTEYIIPSQEVLKAQYAFPPCEGREILLIAGDLLSYLTVSEFQSTG